MPFVNVYRTVTMNLNKRSKNRIWAKVDTKVEKRLEWNKRNRKPEQPNLLKPLWFSFPTFLRSHRLPVFSWQGFIKALVFFLVEKKITCIAAKKAENRKIESINWLKAFHHSFDVYFSIHWDSKRFITKGLQRI
jgi:hypothetical protein